MKAADSRQNEMEQTAYCINFVRKLKIIQQKIEQSGKQDYSTKFYPGFQLLSGSPTVKMDRKQYYKQQKKK